MAMPHMSRRLTKFVNRPNLALRLQEGVAAHSSSATSATVQCVRAVGTSKRSTRDSSSRALARSTAISARWSYTSAAVNLPAVLGAGVQEMERSAREELKRLLPGPHGRAIGTSF
ncbi:hypothetical protein Vafri_10365 [Volvox africanus]|uniref:Uncharacterized protein n=1 Tax=Volvox africanus TaxID=51714 RepID=A0A8J4F0B9_9CHLO|nr:hypothetical protein Vafri_10365 [Volvox africanus]